MAERYPVSAACLAQGGGLLAVILLASVLNAWAATSLWQAPMLLALLQGGIAAMIALRQGAPGWWLVIHLGFMPLVVLVRGWQISAGWFLASFLLLLLVFWRTDRSRVPLYLSNRQTVAALLKLLPPQPIPLIDLGCGTGGVIRRLALERPDCRLVGIEHAPVPWLIARLRTLRLRNVAIRHGDFWTIDLGDYALVYAFLSPVPMADLWSKACAEMRPGALLVSNSFAVPDVEPAAVISVADRRATRLYLYRPASQCPAAGRRKAGVVDLADDSAAFPAIPQPPDQE
jgi:SAM-dependent methyltransferase